LETFLKKLFRTSSTRNRIILRVRKGHTALVRVFHLFSPCVYRGSQKRRFLAFSILFYFSHVKAPGACFLAIQDKKRRGKETFLAVIGPYNSAGKETFRAVLSLFSSFLPDESSTLSDLGFRPLLPQNIITRVL